jgi:hypothetical protein
MAKRGIQLKFRKAFFSGSDTGVADRANITKTSH